MDMSIPPIHSVPPLGGSSDPSDDLLQIGGLMYNIYQQMQENYNPMIPGEFNIGQQFCLDLVMISRIAESSTAKDVIPLKQTLMSWLQMFQQGVTGAGGIPPVGAIYNSITDLIKNNQVPPGPLPTPSATDQELSLIMFAQWGSNYELKDSAAPDPSSQPVLDFFAQLLSTLQYYGTLPASAFGQNQAAYSSYCQVLPDLETDLSKYPDSPAYIATLISRDSQNAATAIMSGAVPPYVSPT